MSGILVVDDEAVVCAALAKALTAPEREVVTARTLAEARDAARSMANIAAVFLDKNMGDVSGLDLIPEIRKAHPFAEFVVVTAYASVESAVHAVSLGVFEYLQKPLPDLPRLELVTRNAIDKSRMMRERFQLLRDLRHSEHRYELAIRASNDGVWDWDLDNKMVYFSPRWKEMLGYDDGDIGVAIDEWFDRVHPRDLEVLKTTLQAYFDGSLQHFEVEYRIRHKKLGYRWCLARGMAHRDDNGRAIRIAGSQSDTTDKRRAVEQIRHDALHDRATGLPNRTLLTNRVEHALATQADPENSRIAVIALEAEKFHLIRAGLGNEPAERLLYGIGERIAECAGTRATVASLGGERFAVLLESTHGAASALEVGKRITGAFKEPFDVAGKEVYVAFCVGVALPEGRSGSTGDEVVRDAEIALAQAKLSGAGEYAVFHKEMHTRSVSLLDLDARLRRALEREELVPYFQPIVASGNGALVGFETLARWKLGDGTIVEPPEFLPRAKDLGLLVDMERQLFFSSCEHVARWHRDKGLSRPLSLSVNVSQGRLWQDQFTDDLQLVFNETGLPPERLKLELLESVVIAEPKAAVERIEELKALGVQVGIDDFGTGYSSLSYLHRLPLNFLKIDRTFVADMAASPKAEALVRSIIALTANLGLTVIAEGVETTEQARYLSQIGCDFMQGFLFGRPASVCDAERWLPTLGKSTPALIDAAHLASAR